MNLNEALTPESQAQNECGDILQSDSMLPDTQLGSSAQFQQIAGATKCYGTSGKKNIFSSDSQLPDIQCQDAAQYETMGIDQYANAKYPLTSDFSPHDIQHTGLGFRTDRRILRMNTSAVTSHNLARTTYFLKAHFQASKSLTVSHKDDGDSVSHRFSATAKFREDDGLAATQAVSSNQSNKANHGVCSDIYLPSAPSTLSTPPSIYVYDEPPSTEVSLEVGGNVKKTYDLPYTATETLTPSSNTIKEGDNPSPIKSLQVSQDNLNSGNLPKASDSQPTSNVASNLLSACQSSVSTSAGSKIPFNKISCKERKRIIISPNRPPNVTKAMIEWVRKTNWLLDPFRENDDCWLHPSPPAALLSVSGVCRPVGTLQKCFTWKDTEGKHSIVLNYGIVVKLINYQMTKQQQDGFVNKQWHLSHLCGNWTCLNPAHTTVEPGRINIGRNKCFSHRS
ncbi:hypothetical protein ONS95_001467 [Cadophora gregata]|uniref:uncharacterized protein n=1 Tax=Cadophora gregata TaxID=51156 RepID=UPI0026DBEF39|nr:uncharacterized protein ONS95_001467 [Cadophora gregata]KAK0111089.1 hypothetical protein ONS95_001467 [Cadophora gregata]